VDSWAEVLAWNSTDSDLLDGAIPLWYQERSNWVSQSSSGDYGHYMAIINPGYVSVGMAKFYTSYGASYATFAGEFSPETSSNQSQAFKGDSEHEEILDMDSTLIEQIAVLPRTDNLGVGQSVNLSAWVLVNGITLGVLPEWSSSDTSIATVDKETGTVTGVAPGTVTISFKIDNLEAMSVQITITKEQQSVSHDTSSCVSARFTDVNKDASNWTHAPIDYVLEKGIMSGVSDTKFDPSGKVTRGMITTILYAQEGKPGVSKTGTFSDVSSSAYYGKPVEWAAANGVVAGYPDGTFKPTNSIARQDLALILYKYAMLKGADTDASGNVSQFTDAGKISSYAETAVKWAVGHGILSGKGNGILDPKGTATRAEVAAVMKSFRQGALGMD